MRTPFIAGNWKMNTTLAEALDLAGEVAKAEVAGVELGIFVPALYAHPIKEKISGSTLRLGGQNGYFEPHGAFTGEISMTQWADLGVSDILVGHSERRQLFAETNAWVNQKTKAALAAGLWPTLCIGETLDQRKAGQEKDVVGTQLAEGLAGVSDYSHITLAYEPVWAIGTGETATPGQAQDMHSFIRNWISENINTDTAERLRILYGGSVKPENAAELLSCPDIDGALVGGASLKAQSFLAIATAGIQTA